MMPRKADTQDGGWRQQYRGAKYGSEAWVKEVATNYADIKDRIEAECDKDKRKAYRDVARSVIEEVRKKVLQELNDARVDLISSSVSALARNSNKIYSTLSAIKAVTEGTGTVISNADLEALKASEKELTNELNREQRKVANREEKIEKAELLGRLRLSKEKHEQKLKLIDAIKEGKEATKEALREQRKQHEEDIKDLRAEQNSSVN